MWGRARRLVLLMAMAGLAAACGGPQSLPKRYAASAENAEVMAMAEAGDADAQLALGQMFEDGRGGRPDYAAAADWYGRAARQGLPLAQYRLGQLYERGLGVPQDYAVAASWYRRAAEQGLDVAQFQMGYFYEKGLGVGRDVDQAVAWYQRAAAGWRSGQAFALAPSYVVASDGAAPLVAQQLATEEPTAAAVQPAQETRQDTAAAPAAEHAPPPEPAAPAQAEAHEGEPVVFDVAAASDADAGPAEEAAAGPAPAPDPVAAREAAPAELADLGAVRVHLASFRTAAEAVQAWRNLRARYDALLAPYGFAVARLDLGEQAGAFYQLQAGPLADAAAAQGLCRALHAAGQFCQPMGP